MCIYSYICKDLVKFLLWRYRGDVLLFASVSRGSLGWRASSVLRTPLLLTKFVAPRAGPWRAVAAVEALWVTSRPALSALTVPRALLGPLGSLAAARLLVHLIHAQLPQRLWGRARRTGTGHWGWWGRRRRILRGALAHLSVAQFPRLLQWTRDKIWSQALFSQQPVNEESWQHRLKCLGKQHVFPAFMATRWQHNSD